MARLIKIVMIQAALFDHDIIYTDGNIEVIGSTSTGKSTIIVVFYAPLLGGSKSRLGIGAQQREFVDYYYSDAKGNPLTNAFIVYEFINDLNEPVCVITHKDKGSFRAELVLGRYERNWFSKNGEHVVSNWEEAKVNIGTKHQRTVIGMPEFNRLMLGAKGAYNPLFSWLHLDDDAYPFQALMSGILKRGDVLSDTVVDAFVAAAFHMKDNPQDEKGINLNPYVKNLRNFKARETDIEIMNQYANGVKSKFPRAIDDVFESRKAIDTAEKELERIPGEYKAAMIREAKRKTSKEKEKTDAEDELKELKAQDDAIRPLNAENLRTLDTKIGQLKGQLDDIDERGIKYQSLDDETTIQMLADWITHKTEIESEKSNVATRITVLSTGTIDIEEARKKSEDEISKAYETKRNLKKAQYEDIFRKLKTRYEAEISILNQKKEELITTLKDVFPPERASALDSVIEKIRTNSSLEAIAQTINDALQSGGADLKWANSRRTEKLDNYEAEHWTRQTDEAVRRAKSIYASLPKQISTFVLAMTSNQNETQKTRMRFVIIKRYFEKRQETALTLIDEQETEAKQRNDDEYDKMKVKKLGKKKAALLKAAETRQKELDRIWNLIIYQFPSAADDLAKINQKERISAEHAAATTRRSNLSTEIAKYNDSYNKKKNQLEGKIRDLGREIDSLAKLIATSNGLKFTYAPFSRLVEAAEIPKIPFYERFDTDQILSEYIRKERELQEMKRFLCEFVKHLYDETYEKHLDAELDTFDLGLTNLFFGTGENASLYESYRAVADNLHARFHGEGTSRAQHYIQEWSEQLTENLKDINRDVGVVEKFMHNIYLLRNRTQRFINANNYTDCFSDVEFLINESTSSLLIAMKEIKEFCQNEGYAIGAGNLFTHENTTMEKKARTLLRAFSEELTRYMSTGDGSGMLRYNEIFDVEFKFKENGVQQRLRNVRDFGSVGTIALFKAYVNMALLAPIMQKRNSASDTYLYCVMDEVNNLPQKHIDTFIEYANKLGFHIIVAGQNHLFEPLDFCYRTEKAPDENGIFYKTITLYATRKIECIDPEDLPEGYTS